MAQRKLRVGLIGANGHNRWGGRVHAPVFQALPETELVAVCTAHQKTAAAAAKKFQVPHALTDFRMMVQMEEVDLVSVSVRVDMHYPIVLAALEAGKHVFCEWPLMVNSQQAQEVYDQARAMGIQHVVGLQSRCSPAVMYLRDLIAQGQIGQPLVVNMIFFMGSALGGRPSYSSYLLTKEGGGSALSIAGGHALDVLCWCFGEFQSLSADVDTLMKEETLVDTGERVQVTSSDNVALVGRLKNGAMVTAQVSWTTDPQLGWQLYAYGTEGSVTATAGEMVQRSGITLRGAKRGEAVPRELSIPSEYNWTPEFHPASEQFNVAQLVRRLAQGIAEGKEVRPNFLDGLRLHHLLESIHGASEVRRWVEIAPGGPGAD